MTDNVATRPLKNVAVLTIAEYADVDGAESPIYVKIKFDPIQPQALPDGDDLPDSYRLMKLVWNNTLGPLVGSSVEAEPSAPAPQTVR